MALAFLQFRGQNNGYYLFQADVGTAKYFKYILGENKHKLRVGKHEFVKVLSGRKKASKLLQVNEIMQKLKMGRFPLKIPEGELNDKTHYIQLYSYNTKSSTAPTISNIVQLYPVVGRGKKIGGLQLSLSQTNYNKNVATMQDTRVKNKAFKYREPQLSKVMFWNAIVNALPTIIKHAAPVIGGLLKGAGNASNLESNVDSSANNQSAKVINKVVEVLQAISNNDSNSITHQTDEQATTTPSTDVTNNETATSDSSEAPAQSSESQSFNYISSAYSLEPDTLIGLKPILEKILSPEAIIAIGDNPQKLFLAIKDAVQKTEHTSNINSDIVEKKTSEDAITDVKYSEAKIAPALLAALPALMPVIEKALDPKIIEAIGNQPVKLFKAIGDTVLKMDEMELKHLEAINPGVDSADDISKLLQGMSISSAYKDDTIKFKMIKNLNLNFINTKTVQFKNKKRVLYQKNQQIIIPFKVVSDSGNTLEKTLKRSIIQICIKDGVSMETVFRKNINLIDVNLNQVINEAFLMPDEIAQIPCNTEIKIELSYIWKSNKNENIGVFKSHYVYFIETYIFDRIGERIGQPIPFNNINVHRPYWHKIWEGGFSRSNRWHIEFDLKYFYLLNPKETGISKLETRKIITEDNVESGGEHPNRRRIKAKLKSGLEFGLQTLNNILSLSNKELLDEEILKIIQKGSIDKEFHQVARQRLEMKGREGDTTTLWSYPEISLHKLYLSKIGTIDDYGQVVTIESIEKLIPKPDLIHFIGTKSER